MASIFAQLPIIILTIYLLTSCTNSTEQSNKSVYLDLVAIAKALGRDNTMQQQQEAATEQLNTQLAQITASLNEQLQVEKSKIGDNPDENGQKKLNSITISANQQLQQSQLLAKQKLALFQQQLLDTFQVEVRSIAQPIAKQRGATSINIIDSSLLWYDASADITDEVIASMRAQASASIVKTAAPKNTEDTANKNTPSKETQKLDALVNKIEAENNQ